eukprot:TRINITY_DN317966_c0_g1_i3.p1 TRINITY_DN317966_c0_g1~~TRINITY_DN317966_c0_g1_i3.p1  ORF type:complete len:873 (+),score=152.05 TRINITY_DN317966_c0_g1_i3:120-2738(+)
MTKITFVPFDEDRNKLRELQYQKALKLIVERNGLDGIEFVVHASDDSTNTAPIFIISSDVIRFGGDEYFWSIEHRLLSNYWISVLLNLFKSANWEATGVTTCEDDYCVDFLQEFEQRAENEGIITNGVVLDDFELVNLPSFKIEVIFGDSEFIFKALSSFFNSTEHTPAQLVLVTSRCESIFSESNIDKYWDEIDVDMLRTQSVGAICIDYDEHAVQQWQTDVWNPATSATELTSQEKLEGGKLDWQDDNMSHDVPSIWDSGLWILETLQTSTKCCVIENPFSIDSEDEPGRTYSGNCDEACIDDLFKDPSEFRSLLSLTDFDGMTIKNNPDPDTTSFTFHSLKAITSEQSDYPMSSIGEDITSFIWDPWAATTAFNSNSISLKGVTWQNGGTEPPTAFEEVEKAPVKVSCIILSIIFVIVWIRSILRLKRSKSSSFVLGICSKGDCIVLFTFVTIFVIIRGIKTYYLDRDPGLLTDFVCSVCFWFGKPSRNTIIFYVAVCMHDFCRVMINQHLFVRPKTKLSVKLLLSFLFFMICSGWRFMVHLPHEATKIVLITDYTNTIGANVCFHENEGFVSNDFSVRLTGIVFSLLRMFLMIYIIGKVYYLRSVCGKKLKMSNRLEFVKRYCTWCFLFIGLNFNGFLELIGNPGCEANLSIPDLYQCPRITTAINARYFLFTLELVIVCGIFHLTINGELAKFKVDEDLKNKSKKLLIPKHIIPKGDDTKGETDENLFRRMKDKLPDFSNIANEWYSYSEATIASSTQVENEDYTRSIDSEVQFSSPVPAALTELLEIPSETFVASFGMLDVERKKHVLNVFGGVIGHYRQEWVKRQKYLLRTESLLQEKLAEHTVLSLRLKRKVGNQIVVLTDSEK